MLNVIRRLIDSAFRESKRAWRTYHDAEKACRVLCEQGHAGFVYVLKERLNELLAEYPMEAAVKEAADRLHGAMSEAEHVVREKSPMTGRAWW